MAAELQHHLPYFVADLGSELVALRIYDAGHREILPYHYALPVAPVVERLVFIDVASPAADHVAVQVCDHVDSAVHPLVIAAVEAVERHPVRPSGEYLLSVYIEAEASGCIPVYISHFQAHRPEAYLPGVGRKHIAAVVRKGYRAVVQGRIAIAFRPPEFGPLDGEFRSPRKSRKPPVVMVDHLSILGEGHVYHYLVHHRHRILCLDIHEYLCKASLRIGVHRHPVHVRQAHRLFHYKVDASPQARANEPRHYVPSVAVARLPDPDRLGVMTETGDPYHILLGLLDS